MRTYKEILDRLMENPKLREMYNKNRKKEEVWNALPKEKREFVMNTMKSILNGFNECVGEYFCGLDNEIDVYLNDLKRYPAMIPDELLECVGISREVKE